METNRLTITPIFNHWSSAVPKKYKRNAVLGDLHKMHKIASNFELKNSALQKNILVLISRTISFNLLLFRIRWDEYSDIGKNSEPSKHLNFLNTNLTGKVLEEFRIK